MLCTDVAAWGIDIPNVKTVINYQMPVNAETYVHRCGRTARIGNSGTSYSLLSPDDEKNFWVIYRVLNKGKALDDEDGKFVGDITQYEVDLVALEQNRNFMKKAMELERALFSKEKNIQRADWLLKVSKESGIDIPEDLRREMDGLDEWEKELMSKHEKKREKKEKQKNKIEVWEKRWELKKASLAEIGTTSTFLNPNSVKYLNEIVFGGEKAKSVELNRMIT